jgi:hypothetical protein
VSFEKCTGYPGVSTEVGIYRTAAQLKALNPSLRVLFYLHTDLHNIICYAASARYLASPDWWLRDRNGVVRNDSFGIPYMNFSVPAARAWWVSIPLNGSGSPGASLIDGMLADGTSSTSTAGCADRALALSPAECAAQVAGKRLMVRDLQAVFDAANGGPVIGNGITMYPKDTDQNMGTLGDSDGIMAEHFATFESVLGSGALNVTRVALFMQRVGEAAAAGRMVVVATWPGLLVGPTTPNGFYSWPRGTQPNTTGGWAPVMLQKHTFALAGALTMAHENVWMMYQTWYNGITQGAIPCPANPASCSAPSAAEWYPALYRGLGAPLGPPLRVGNTWTRNFERAVSVLNLDTPDASSVTFFSASQTPSSSPSASAASSPSASAASSATGSAASSATGSAASSATATPAAATSSSRGSGVGGAGWGAQAGSGASAGSSSSSVALGVGLGVGGLALLALAAAFYLYRKRAAARRPHHVAVPPFQSFPACGDDAVEDMKGNPLNVSRVDGLPEGWVMFSEGEEQWFYHAASGESRWERPV